MRRIAIIGSGIAGLVAAHGLLRAGHEVTLYSDRTAEQWLHEARPTGTAARFEMALAYERSLGLNHWDDVCPPGQGVHLTFSPKVGNRLITLAGRLDHPFRAVDVRLQSHRWMNDFEARGGRLVIESVDVEALDRIAAEHELTAVAAGRAELIRLFPRDAVRSVYDAPQRHLAMVLTGGGSMTFQGIPYTPVKFNLFATEGEAFWVPYYHPTAGASWCMLFEAKPGRRMDRFEGVTSGEEAWRIGLEIIRELIPWDYDWAREQTVADKNGWLVGKFAPTVREPVGRLPSGRLVTCLGDTCMSLDPIGGQGANNGSKMVKNFVESVMNHGDRPFDEAFMRATFERHWQEHGRWIYTFNNALLEPLSPAGQQLLIAQYGSNGLGDSGQQAIADAFIRNFNDPRSLTDGLLEVEAARRHILALTGRPWWQAVPAGAVGVGWNQLRQAVGFAPHHPQAPAAQA